MPMLTEIATVLNGKNRAVDAKNALIGYSKTFPQEQNGLKNRMRVTLNIGSTENLGEIKLPAENDKLFAGWCDKLNRQPVYDLFNETPINKVKPKPENVEDAVLAFKYEKWINKVRENMEKFGFKRN